MSEPLSVFFFFFSKALGCNGTFCSGTKRACQQRALPVPSNRVGEPKKEALFSGCSLRQHRSQAELPQKPYPAHLEFTRWLLGFLNAYVAGQVRPRPQVRPHVHVEPVQSLKATLILQPWFVFG